MAQPLSHTEIPSTGSDLADLGAVNGIDVSAARLEKAFRRLESAVSQIGKGYASLKADREKLNHLLQASQEEIGKMQQAVELVSGRLDHTIGRLEALGQ